MSVCVHACENVCVCLSLCHILSLCLSILFLKVLHVQVVSCLWIAYLTSYSKSGRKLSDRKEKESTDTFRQRCVDSKSMVNKYHLSFLLLHNSEETVHFGNLFHSKDNSAGSVLKISKFNRLHFEVFLLN